MLLPMRGNIRSPLRRIPQAVYDLIANLGYRGGV